MPEPPVQCGSCGAEIKFAPGQVVGNPDSIANVKRALHLEALLSEALERGNAVVLMAESLANEAARACTEPRRFQENEDKRQQKLSQAKPSR